MFRGKHDIVLENLALRQQLVVQQRSIIRSKIKNTDRIFWIWLSRIWNDWRSSLIIVKAPTVIGWHKKGFKSYWKRKSRRVGRPTIDWELIKFIRMLQKENVTWSAQRIQGELKKLGYDVCDNTVAKYMTKVKDGDNSKQQQWLTFLKNHAKYIVGIDFVVVRTVFFKAIYVFVAISHDRRKILHFAVTANPLAERVLGTIRRECLDHMIILNEKHLHSVLDEYINDYYNVSRTHMSLEKDSPEHRPIQKDGKIVSKPILGGLHHVYSRVA